MFRHENRRNTVLRKQSQTAEQSMKYWVKQNKIKTVSPYVCLPQLLTHSILKISGKMDSTQPPLREEVMKRIFRCFTSTWFEIGEMV